MLGGDGGAGFRRRICDGEQGDIAFAHNRGIFGGVVTAKRARANNSGLERTRFRHPAAKKQMNSPPFEGSS